MQKIRLLIISFNDLGHGGIQSQFMNITRNLQEVVDSDVVVWSKKPAFYDEEFKKYGRIIYCSHYEGNNKFWRKIDYFIRYFKIKSDIYEIIQKYGPYDVVHCHKFFECAPCLAAAKKAGVSIRIAHSHNTEHPVKHKNFAYYIKRIYNAWYRRLIRKYSTNMIGCSQQAADYLFGPGYGIPIYNSINTQLFDISKYQTDKHAEIRMIHVGKFCEQKNQLFLIDILKEMKKLRPDTTLTLIGGGEAYYDNVVKKINELGLEDSVTLLPHDTDVPYALSQADVFVFPSTFEGFGNVLIEAQAMGLKCFASTEVTSEADCGLLSFISLKSGSKRWAEEIYLEYKNSGFEKKKVDVSRFASETNAMNFLDFYKGKYKTQNK